MRTEIDSIRIFERSIPKKHCGAYLGPRSFLLRLYVEPYEGSRLEYSVDAGFFSPLDTGFPLDSRTLYILHQSLLERFQTVDQCLELLIHLA